MPCLLGVSLLVWGPGATAEKGGFVMPCDDSSPPLEGLKAEVSCQGGQPAPGDRAPIKSLDPEAQVCFPGWQYHHVLLPGEWGRMVAWAAVPQGRDSRKL